MKYQKSIYNDEYRIFINLLKEYRESKGITQADFSKLLHADQPYVSKYETFIRRIDFIELKNICQALNISLHTFFDDFEKRLNQKSKKWSLSFLKKDFLMLAINFQSGVIDSPINFLSITILFQSYDD